MSSANLIKMANQIGAFFEAMPDAEQQVAGVADHIRKFWEPRMRSELATYLAANGDGELKSIVRQALTRLASSQNN